MAEHLLNVDPIILVLLPATYIEPPFIVALLYVKREFEIVALLPAR